MADIAREMLISHDSSETRVALLENRELVELYVERPKRSVVGNVYLGKISDVLPGMQAAFVDIGLEKNAFLYVDEIVTPEGVEGVPRRDIQDLVRPGQSLMVQVLKDPMGTKGARVTTEITLPGRFLVLMPFSDFVGVSRKLPDAERERLQAAVAPSVPDGMGVIVRTVAQGADERDLSADLDFLLRLWKRVRRQGDEALPPEVIYTEMDLALRIVRDVFSDDFKRLTVDDKSTHQKVVSFLKKTSPNLARRVQQHKDKTCLFDAYKLQPTIDAALRRTVELPSGGYIAIDRTEALTAIDVNTGRFVGKRNLDETILKTNRGAGGGHIRFNMAKGSMNSHISQFPTGTYKKGHAHGPGAHVIILSGEGYSLMWPEGEEPQRYDWEIGTMVVPPNMWFHQHFNSGTAPARYLAFKHEGVAVRNGQGVPKAWISKRLGGDQIDYADELPAVRKIFADELARNGLSSRMDAAYAAELPELPPLAKSA